MDYFCDDVTKAILDAAAKSIPRGCRKDFKPFWTPEIQDAVDRRSKARKAVEENPTDETKMNYNRECAKVKLAVNSAKRQAWAKTTGELNLSQNGTKAWSLLNNLCGENRKQNPKPMFCNNETIIEDEKKAAEDEKWRQQEERRKTEENNMKKKLEETMKRRKGLYYIKTEG